MRVEFDHVFICVSAGGEEEASSLVRFGLTEGSSNLHPGQGTACRRFFFANGYLELLWVCHAGEAQSATTRPTCLWERWENRANGACPFGLGLRPRVQHVGPAPFSSWEYRPLYLPSPLSIRVATNASALTEPMLFYLPFARRPDSHPMAQPLRHRAGLHEVTRLELVSPYVHSLSPEIAAVTAPGLAILRAGPQFLVELGFDQESQGQQADFRPGLPLLFCW